MEFIKSFFLLIVICIISSTTIIAQDLFQFEIKKLVIYNNSKNVYLKLNLTNNTLDSIEITHPGILFSAFDGYHPINSFGFSFGLYSGDSLLNWNGNCDMKPTYPKKKLVFNDGIFIINPLKIDNHRNSKLKLNPNTSADIEIFIVISDCYLFTENSIYNLNEFGKRKVKDWRGNYQK